MELLEIKQTETDSDFLRIIADKLSEGYALTDWDGKNTWVFTK